METKPVGLKKANDWGFYDLSGNVWEWCGDHLVGAGQSIQDFNKTDILKTGERFSKGGGWFGGEITCRIDDHIKHSLNWFDYALGFRLAWSPIPEM